MHGIARQHRTAPRRSVLRSVTQALEMMSGIYCITVQGSLIFRCVTPQNLTTVGQRRMHHQKRGRASMVCFHGRSMVHRPYDVRVLLKLPSAQSPFARTRCYLARRGLLDHVSRCCPAFSAHTDSCANPPPSWCLGGTLNTRSVQVAVSPCWEKDLPDVISAHLSLRAWTPTPAARVVHVPVSSHTTSAFPSFGPGRRSAKPVQRFQYGALFEAAVIS